MLRTNVCSGIVCNLGPAQNKCMCGKILMNGRCHERVPCTLKQQKNTIGCGYIFIAVIDSLVMMRNFTVSVIPLIEMILMCGTLISQNNRKRNCPFNGIYIVILSTLWIRGLVLRSSWSLPLLQLCSCFILIFLKD